MASVLDEGEVKAFIFPGSTVEIWGGGGLGKFLYDPQRPVRRAYPQYAQASPMWQVQNSCRCFTKGPFNEQIF